MQHSKNRGFPFSRYPAVRLVIVLGFGYLYGTEIPFWVMVASIATLILIERVFYLYPVKALYTLIISLYMITLFLFGGFYRSWVSDSSYQSNHLLTYFTSDTLVVQGVVVQGAPTSGGRYAMTLKTDFSRNIRLYWDDADPEKVYTGKTIVAPVRFYSFPEKRNPNEFDYGAWLIRQGIHHHGMISGPVHVMKEAPSLSWANLRQRLYDQIRVNFSETHTPLALAVLLGYKAALDTDLRVSFSRAGLSHIMAVSGMHVGFILMPLWLAIPLFWASRPGRLAAFFLIASTLFLYAGITGFTASVNRASLMAILLAWGKLYQKPRNGVNLMGVAALSILLADPEFIYDIGFQLSFTAVLIIFLLMPVYQQLIPLRYRFRWMGSVLSFLGVSVVVQGGLYPILAFYFGEFSWIGPVSNLIAVPLTQLFFLWSFLTLPLTFIIESHAAIITFPAEGMAALLSRIAATAETMEGAWSATSRPDVWFFVAWFSGLACIASLPYPFRRWKFLIVFLIVLVVKETMELTRQFKPPLLEFVFYDVGQGDAVLILTPNGKTILYDTGQWSPSRNSGRDVIVPDLVTRGITYIDLIILSHPHADHIGGMTYIMEHFPVERIIHSGFEYPSAINLGWLSASGRLGYPVYEALRGMDISPDPNVKMLVLHPGILKSGRDPNPHSVVIHVHYGNISVLLTGDGDHITENRLVETFGSFLKSNLLKAGHHGSRTSSTRRFVDLVNPDWVVVSVARSNRYQHPHIEAARNLVSEKREVRYTGIHKAQQFFTDGKALHHAILH